MSSTRETCWACGGDAVHPIFGIDKLALSSLSLVESHQAAVDFPSGDLELVVCETCGFIYNRLFRPDLVDYTMPYESSQIFSPRFRAFAEELIDHLIKDYDLTGKEILEIGCGDASFLQALVRKAEATGFGIDPTYDSDRIEDELEVSGIAAFFDSEHTNLTADLICCRHTLEHIQPVGEFVFLVRESASHRPGAVVFFEIPDTERILEEGAFWDVYNEHCSYFTLVSLSNLFRSRGFEVLRLAKGFDDQYLLIDTVVGDVDESIDREAVQQVVDKAKRFGSSAAATVDSWQKVIDQAVGKGETVALWGASSKAVAFLAAVDRNQAIAAAVDINPFKQDKYLPGSGVSVIAPERLKTIDADLVIVMNPIYVEEIRATLRDLDLHPELLALGDTPAMRGLS